MNVQIINISKSILYLDKRRENNTLYYLFPFKKSGLSYKYKITFNRPLKLIYTDVKKDISGIKIDGKIKKHNGQIIIKLYNLKNGLIQENKENKMDKHITIQKIITTFKKKSICKNFGIINTNKGLKIDKNCFKMYTRCKLFQEPKILALDFDGTLVKSESINGGVGAIFNPQLKAFSNALVDKLDTILKTSGKFYIYITSFNSLQNINEYLNAFPMLKRCIMEVLTPESFNVDRNRDVSNIFQGKNVMLNYLKTKHKLLDNSSILLVDDSVYNIENAKKYGYRAEYVSNISSGINFNNIISIKKFLSEHN